MRIRLWISALAALTALPAPAFEMPPRDSFDATVDRPLFFPGRRAGPPDSAPPPADIATVAVPAPAGMRLIGLALDRKGRAVAVWRAEGAEGPERRVVAGDTVGGWTVESVGRDGVDLSLAGRRTTVSIAGILPNTPD